MTWRETLMRPELQAAALLLIGGGLLAWWRSGRRVRSKSGARPQRTGRPGAVAAPVATGGFEPVAAADRPATTFGDVAGLEEPVEELREIRDYLTTPERFQALGAAMPRGVLLYGPPGTGKTLLARALAGETGARFYSLSGADFDEVYIGVGAARVRSLFKEAKAAAPAIVFIDELEAAGRHRASGPGGGSQEREATLLQLLAEMDGFEPGRGVVVVGATNRPDILDPALLRPGRFDRRVPVDLPDVEGRTEILRLHLRDKPLGRGVDIPSLARRTSGFSGADLAGAVNEAALLAARSGRTSIEASDLSEGVERVVAGPARRSRVLRPEERRRIAYHEAGHAVTQAAVTTATDVAKVSILARGQTGGTTWLAPMSDQMVATRSELLGRIVTLLGGLAAEQLIFGDPSTGTQDDLRRAADLARSMVVDFGMGSRPGPHSVHPALGTRLGGMAPLWSEQFAATVDCEIESILGECQLRADRLVEANRDVLDVLADQLCSAESLEGDGLRRLLERVQAAGPAPQATAGVLRSATGPRSGTDHTGGRDCGPGRTGKPR